MNNLYIFFIEYTASVDFFKNCGNAMKPMHLTSGAAVSDLFSTSNKLCIGERRLHKF